MRLSPTIERVPAIALAIAAGLLWFSWRAALRSQAQLSATLASKNEAIAKDRVEMAKLNEDLAAQLDAIRKDEAQTKTSGQILAKLPSYLPLPEKLGLAHTSSGGFLPPSKKARGVEPQGDLDVTPRDEVSRFESGGTPISEPQKQLAPSPREEISSAPLIEIPAPDLKPLFDFSADCKACQITVAQQKEAIRLLGQEVDSLKAERDAAVKASRGGGFWSRLKSNAHWFAIGGALAAGGICASRHCK